MHGNRSSGDVDLRFNQTWDIAHTGGGNMRR